MDRESVKKSYLEVNKITAYFIVLISFILVFMSLGILYPFCYHIYSKYFINHTYIDNKRLEYTGTKKGMFLTFIIYYIIAIIVLFGIEYLLKVFEMFHIISVNVTMAAIYAFLFSFFVQRKMKIYAQKHTHFFQSMNKDSYYSFHFFKMIIAKVLIKIISLITVYILYPLSCSIEEKYDSDRKVIDGKKFTYHPKYRKYIFRWILDIVLVFVTLFIYLPMVIVRVKIYLAQFIHIKEEKVALW